MLGYALLANPHTADKMLTAAGYLAGLGQLDVRELSQTRIPVWAVALGSLAVGLAAGVWVARKLPADWILGKKSHER